MPYLLIPPDWEYTTSSTPSDLPYLTSNTEIITDVGSWGWTVMECVHVLPRMQELQYPERDRELEDLWRRERVRREGLEADMERIRTRVRERAPRRNMGRDIEEDEDEAPPPPYPSRSSSIVNLLNLPPAYEEGSAPVWVMAGEVPSGNREMDAEHRQRQTRWARIREVVRELLELQGSDGRARAMQGWGI